MSQCLGLRRFGLEFRAFQTIGHSLLRVSGSEDPGHSKAKEAASISGCTLPVCGLEKEATTPNLWKASDFTIMTRSSMLYGTSTAADGMECLHLCLCALELRCA